MSTNHSLFRRRMLALANGGHVRGPGSGTSDSIPARLSDGEFVLPTDTVRKVGVRRLQDLVDMTHTPSGKAPHPAQYADGGLVGLTPFKRREDYASNALQAMEQQRADSERAAQSAMAQQRQTDADAAAAASQPRPAAAAGNVGPAPSAATGGQQGGSDRLSNLGSPAPGAAVPAPQSSSSSVAQIPTDGYRPAPTPDGSQDSWRNTEVGRNLTNAAAALPGVAGALPAVVKTGGAISSGLDAAARLMNIGVGAVGASVVPTLAAAAPAKDPGAGATPTAGAGRGYTNPPSADPSAPPPSLAKPATAPAETDWNRNGMTNAQVAQANPQGAVTARRSANGTMEFSGGNVSGPVSYADSSGKPMAGSGIEGRGWGGFTVAPAGANVAMGPNGSYAFASKVPDQQTQSSTRSPVGMSVEQAQQAGLVDERVGYDPRYDQRLTGARGQPTAQNMAAADALAGRQDAGARARLMAAAGIGGPGSGPVEPGSFTGGFSGVIGSSSTYGNMRGRSFDQRLRDAEVSAGSIMNTRKWGGPGAENNPSVLAYGALLKQDSNRVQNQAAAEIEAQRQATALLRDGMHQAGENRRAAMTGQRYADANQIDRARLAIDQAEAGFKNRVAQRIESAQLALENAQTPTEQRGARERLLALAGKSVHDSAKDRYLSVGGGQSVRDGQTVKDPMQVYDTHAQQWLQPPGQGASPAVPSSKDALVKGQVYQTARGPARWDGGQFQPTR